MADDREDQHPSLNIAEVPKKEPAPSSPLSATEASDKPEGPHPLSRRELVGLLPKVALGSLLATEEEKGLAFGNGLFFKGRSIATSESEIFGLWAFGSNDNGQLGMGDVTFRSSPVQMGNLRSWMEMLGGFTHTVARRTDGTLWAFGSNLYGQLGLGDQTFRSSPVQVGNLSIWTEVAGGLYHTVARRSDGTLWTFGDNFYGQLGIGTTTGHSSPVQVGTLSRWTKLAKGLYHTMAMSMDDTLWAFGYNNSGQLGIGTTTGRSSPVQVGTLSNWTEVAGGYAHTLARRNDGTLWACYVNRQPKKNKSPDPTFLDCCSFLIAA